MYLTEDNAITTSCSLIQFPLEQILLTFPMINYRSVPTLMTICTWNLKYLKQALFDIKSTL